MSKAPAFLATEGHPEDRDLVLLDQEPFWITIGSFSVWIRPDAKSIQVDIFPLGKADEEPLASCEAGHK